MFYLLINYSLKLKRNCAWVIFDKIYFFKQIKSYMVMLYVIYVKSYMDMLYVIYVKSYMDMLYVIYVKRYMVYVICYLC